MAVVGRISGQLLRPNLLRDGVDLAFETDLLYLSVVDPAQPLKVVGIGVNTGSPQYALDVNGTAQTTNLITTDSMTVGNFTIGGAGFENTIRSDLSTITFAPSGADPTIFAAKVQVDDIQLSGNVISTENSNADLVLRANGTGLIEIDNDARVIGNLTVTGNINAGGNVVISGNISIGDNLSDSIEINASIQSDLIPQSDGVYDLGSIAYRWKNLYASNVLTDVLSVTSMTIGNIILQNNQITTTTGQDLILDANGAGAVKLGNFSIVGNQITNFVANAVSELTQSGYGYFKIVGTNGFIPPVGTTLQQPNPALYGTLPIGLTRYNTNSKSLEVWDGLLWQSPAGATGAVSEIKANDIAAEMALTLG